jgi:hypothetical protein
MMRHFSIFMVLALLIVGCAAIGPVSSPEFPSLVAKTIPKEDGEIRLFGSGNWYPNVRGFTAIRSSLLATPADPTPGVLVITDEALLFQQWDEEAKIFDVIKRLPYSELVAVSLDTYGLNRRIVLRKTDLSYDSFDFTQASGTFVDATKVEQAIGFLRGRIKP